MSGSSESSERSDAVRLKLVVAAAFGVFSLAASVFMVLVLSPSPSPSSSEAGPSGPPALEVAPVEPPTRPDATSSVPAPVAAEPAAAKPKLDRFAHDRMRDQIKRSLAKRSPSPNQPTGARPADPTVEQAAALPVLDADYIRERIQADLLPVAIECYDSALADDPELAGKLTMKFAILGEPEVGGVVDEATIDDEQSSLASEFMRECVRESLMAVTFDAPPEGGRVDVTFPFVFAPDDE